MQPVMLTIHKPLKKPCQEIRPSCTIHNMLIGGALDALYLGQKRYLQESGGRFFLVFLNWNHRVSSYPFLSDGAQDELNEIV